MPGLLRVDACCPRCGDPIEALVHTSSHEHVIAEYYHSPGSPKARRKRRCKVIETPVTGQLDMTRKMLEVAA